MTTRLRGRWARAAALIALTGGTVAVSVTPATAAPQTVRILSVSAENVRPGQTVRVRFRVTNNGSGSETAIVVVGGGLRCTTGCRVEPRLGAGRSQTFDTKLVAPPAHPGEITGLNISIGVRLGGQNSFAYQMVYVHGPGASSPEQDKPVAGVKRVSGRVRDTGGKAIRGVDLTIRDSAGHKYRATSDRSGKFSITSSAGKTIAEGPITVAAAMDGYRTGRTTVRGTAGAVATVRLTLSAVAAPTKTSPSPSAAASPLAADDTPEAAPPTLKAVSDEGGSSPLFFILGGLLVAAGLGALALMAMRRRNAPAVPEATVPATTQLMAPVGGSMADAPTAVLRTVPGGGGVPRPYGAFQQNGPASPTDISVDRRP
jgi:MYXO-CTERM domain-containing protein